MLYRAVCSYTLDASVLNPVAVDACGQLNAVQLALRAMYTQSTSLQVCKRRLAGLTVISDAVIACVHKPDMHVRVFTPRFRGQGKGRGCEAIASQ